MFELPAQLPTFWFALASLLFLVKHLFADFLLQTKWMAIGKEKDEGWIAPLAFHAAIHGAATLLLCLLLAPALAWLAAIDFVVHAALDRMKGLAMRRLAASATAFWWLLGVDQALHGLTHLLFILWIAAAHATA